MNEIKTAVIGVGRLGRFHTRWLKKIAGSELVGVYDSDKKRSEEVAREFSVRSFESLEDVFDSAEAISIAANTSAHFSLATKALESGKHLLVEKPFTETAAEAQTLIDLASKKNLTLTVGHIERFNPAFRSLANKNINPRFIEAHRMISFDPRGADVAVILDLMVHDIDLALKLIASPVKSIEASAVRVVSDYADIANARISFECGAVANLTASRISLTPMRKLRIFQPSGYFSLDFQTRRLETYTLMKNGSSPEAELKKSQKKIPLGKSGASVLYESHEDTESDMLKAELEAFLAAVRGEAEVVVTPTDAKLALEIAIEVERIAGSAEN